MFSLHCICNNKSHREYCNGLNFLYMRGVGNLFEYKVKVKSYEQNFTFINYT